MHHKYLVRIISTSTIRCLSLRPVAPGHAIFSAFAPYGMSLCHFYVSFLQHRANAIARVLFPPHEGQQKLDRSVNRSTFLGTSALSELWKMFHAVQNLQLGKQTKAIKLRCRIAELHEMCTN